MLYGQSKRYLLEKLTAAGLKSRPYTTLKALQKSQESHVGAVLFEREAYARNNSKKRFRDEEGAKHKRRKVFDRAVTFVVLIGDYTDDNVEAMLERFIALLDRGIMVDGNYVPIAVEGAEWVDTEDTLLKAQVAARVTVTFNGGVYIDTDFRSLAHIEMAEVEKANGDEIQDGKQNNQAAGARACYSAPAGAAPDDAANRRTTGKA